MVDLPQTDIQAAGQMAGQAVAAGQQVAQAGGGILNTLKNIVLSPINALAGFGKGVLNLGTLTMGGLLSVALAAAHYLLPDVWGAGAQAIGGDKLRAEQAIGDKSLWEVLKQHLILGMGASAAINGAQGAWNGVSETTTTAREEGSTLGSIASTVAGVAAFAGIAFVGIGAYKHYAEGSSVTPPATPAGAGKSPEKGT